MRATGGGGLPRAARVVIGAGGSSMRSRSCGAPRPGRRVFDRSIEGMATTSTRGSWRGWARCRSRQSPLAAPCGRKRTARCWPAARRCAGPGGSGASAGDRHRRDRPTATAASGSPAPIWIASADWSARAQTGAAALHAGLPANGSVGCFVIGGGAPPPTLRRARASEAHRGPRARRRCRRRGIAMTRPPPSRRWTGAARAVAASRKKASAAHRHRPRLRDGVAVFRPDRRRSSAASGPGRHVIAETPTPRGSGASWLAGFLTSSWPIGRRRGWAVVSASSGTCFPSSSTTVPRGRVGRRD